MKSYYKFTQYITNKYPHISLANAAYNYEINYDLIILNNIYETTHNYKKVKTTNLTLQELRSYLLEINYCYQIYLDTFNNLKSMLDIIEVDYNNKTLNLNEVFSLISLMPFCGLNQINIGANLYEFLINIKPYYYQLLKLYL